jgi:hypothetical protein
MQANSLEVLEHLLAPDLYRRLVTGIDPESTTAQKLSLARRLCQTGVDSHAEALRILLHSGDGWLCACALHAIGQGRLAELAEDVRRLPHNQMLLDQTWEWTSARLSGAGSEKGVRMLTLLEKVDFLREAAIFRDLPMQSLVRIAAIASELSWTPQQMLYQEDTPAESIFFLLEGEVELLRSGTVAQRKGKHQVMGSLAALADGSHTESAVTTQAARGLRMDREELFDAMSEDFGVARGILKALAGMATAAA